MNNQENQQINASHTPSKWAKAGGVRFVAILTWLMGAVNLFSAIRPTMMRRMEIIQDVIPLEVRVGSRLITALVGFGLFLLAFTLWRRKRASWWLTLFLLGISAIAHLLKGLDYPEASLALLLILLLLIMRKSFYRASDPPSVLQGIIVLITAFFFSLIYGIAGFGAYGFHSRHPIALKTAISQTLALLVSAYDPTPMMERGFGRYFINSVTIIEVVTIGFAVYMLIRPVLIRKPASEEERQRAAKIVFDFGRTTTAFLALFDDKHYFFSPGGSMIAYAVHGMGALALGDPIGPHADAPAAIAAFNAYCQKNDWQPAFLYVLPEGLEHYHAADFKTLCVAYEAIVALDSFTLESPKSKALRNPYNKLLRMGYQAKVYLPPIDKGLIEQLRLVSDAWLSSQIGGEKHFIVGYFKDDYVCNCPIIAIHAPDGHIAAFANIVSDFNKNEITIDLMRHQRELENGTMEFLFVSLLQWAKSQGYETFSLGATTIFGKGEEENNSSATRILFLIAAFVNRFYRFKGLYTFKNKFQPRWEPRYVAYPGALSLPILALTLINVHSGKNFLWWYLRK